MSTRFLAQNEFSTVKVEYPVTTDMAVQSYFLEAAKFKVELGLTAASELLWGLSTAQRASCGRGLVAQPPAESRGRAPGQRVRGHSPPEKNRVF